MKEHQKQIVENFIRSYNSFDVEGMLRDLHPDVVFENIVAHKVDLKTKGIEAFAQQAEKAKQYFSQRHQRVVSWYSQKDKVSVEIDYEAILLVDLPNGIKAGETLSLKGKSEFTFKADKIVRIRDIS